MSDYFVANYDVFRLYEKDLSAFKALIVHVLNNELRLTEL